MPQDGAFSFDALLQRIHPAASRIKLGGRNARPADRVRSAGRTPTACRWTGRCASAAAPGGLRARTFRRPLRLSPSTTRLAQAKAWLERVGATLDGIIAKRRDLAYRSGDRTGMQKIKNYRSADCVVGGFRYNEGKPVVGSLLLGLYDATACCTTSASPRRSSATKKPALTAKLEKLIAPPGFTGNAPGGPSRWSTKRSAQWQPLKPKLVVEVRYDHFSGDRFRHGTTLLRWRPDKSPAMHDGSGEGELDDAAGAGEGLISSWRMPRQPQGPPLIPTLRDPDSSGVVPRARRAGQPIL